jgi:hypothetical protein
MDLIRCLILNLAVLLTSGTLLLWYPKESGFTLTTRTATHFFGGGEFLGVIVMCLCDLALAVYLGPPHETEIYMYVKARRSRFWVFGGVGTHL